MKQLARRSQMQSQGPRETQEIRAEDLTIVIPIQANNDDAGITRRDIHNAQIVMLERISDLGCKILRLDYGSSPALEIPPRWITPVVYGSPDGPLKWHETKAKNMLLNMVATDYTLLTNADVLITPQAIEKTLNAVKLNGNPKHFVLQGVRWEVPRLLTSAIVEYVHGGDDISDLIGHATRLSIPAAIPRLPTGEWQVFRTEDALAIGGMDERMTEYGSSDTDLHERLRLYIIAKYGDLACEIMCRSIPVLHAYHSGARPSSPHKNARAENLAKFIKSGDVKDLKWNAM